MGNSETILLLQMGIWIIVFIMIALVCVYLYLMKPKKVKQEKETDTMIEDTSKDNQKKIDQNYGKFIGNLTRESIFEFMVAIIPKSINFLTISFTGFPIFSLNSLTVNSFEVIIA